MPHNGESSPLIEGDAGTLFSEEITTSLDRSIADGSAPNVVVPAENASILVMVNRSDAATVPLSAAGTGVVR